MICQKCGQNESTTIFKQSINGKSTIMHICDECAYKIGCNNLFDSFNINYVMNNMLHKNQRESIQCKNCSTTLTEINNTGKMGCAECYNTFKSQLEPTIEKIHGRVKHIGKVPTNFANSNQAENQPNQSLPQQNSQSNISLLKDELKTAIKNQEFETAAILRDKIAQVESDGEQNG